MQHAYPNDDPDGFIGVRYWAPPESLKSYFGSIYHFTAKLPEYYDITRADTPQLRFMLAGGGFYRFQGKRDIPTPMVCMIGPTMSATEFFLDSPTIVLGVSILPMGWMALGCGDADAQVDTIYDMAAKHGEQYTRILEHIRGERNPDAAVASMWDFLAQQISPVSVEVHNLVAAIDHWLSQNSSPEIEQLIDAIDLSARQVARHTKRLYGASPKALARKYRALRCAAQIVLDQKNWRELCDEGTFYDQAHFIREIKHFLGMTPHKLLNNPTEVARWTTQRRAMTGLVSELHRIS
jgi:AraC-like DNA-binding protein